MVIKEYQEDEVKVLNVSPKAVCGALEKLGAKRVFEGKRVFTSFDDDQRSLVGSGKIFRLTEEGKLKLSVSYPVEDGKKTVKLFVSRKKETIDLLVGLGFFPITRVESRRVSYEWGKIDFDLDFFPEIPPFLEIDRTHLKIPLEKLLKRLSLESNELFLEGTEAVYKHYNIDYFERFKVKK